MSGWRGIFILCGLALLVSGAVFTVLELRVPVPGGAGDSRTGPLRLSVPEMERVDGLPVATAQSGNEAALKKGPVRLAGTGLPSARESNVYISGHRLGYPGTGSFLVFRDLNVLRDGDNVVLRGGGRRYLYRVFERKVVGPGALSVTEPVDGRNIVSLQTCTLPDYRQRLVVRAELVRTTRV
ncbi:class E sortase [Rubrobacter aplysinae]|uniref:class E sortase n=1 Tax=Rubrobacter aplysinae TaxID=909625 RepID=UPI00064BA794|nr:class E sortase [Rubrobacter aplysinae]